MLSGFSSNSSCDPTSATFPPSITTIWSACLMVLSRCAIINTVRFRPSANSASCMEFSVMVSNALVASSSSTTEGFFSRHRAMATRCFSPPDNFNPLSPTIVSHCSGSASTNDRICAASAASFTSSKEASSRP
mmetsp:Transcript_9705/g.16041  ORF Transcript_9705/g.16041 Transcript_9705/m.16041 type:complete len:133 (-) Transcript_9705:70-468(-)